MRVRLLWAWLAAGTALGLARGRPKREKKSAGRAWTRRAARKYDGAYYHNIKCLAQLAPVIRDALDGDGGSARTNGCCRRWRSSRRASTPSRAPAPRARGPRRRRPRPPPRRSRRSSGTHAGPPQGRGRRAHRAPRQVALVVDAARALPGRPAVHGGRPAGARRRARAARVRPHSFGAENETLAETVRLFEGARVVVGYHGAGFANVLFQRPRRRARSRSSRRTTTAGPGARTPACASTRILNGARSGSASRRCSPRIRMRSGRRRSGTRWSRASATPNRWLKAVAWVDLNATDVARVAAAAAACGGLPRGKPKRRKRTTMKAERVLTPRALIRKLVLQIRELRRLLREPSRASAPSQALAPVGVLVEGVDRRRAAGRRRDGLERPAVERLAADLV